MVTLHVLNGDAVEAPWRAAKISDDVVTWGEILAEGPVGPDAPPASAARAEWLEAHLGVPRAEFDEKARRCFARLDELQDGDEVVLWFEEDLFCQTNLLHALDRLAATGARVSLVLPESALGDRPVDDYAVLHAERREASDALVGLARRAWAAYASPDPTGLVRLLDDDFTPWPLLRRGIEAHLARYPDPGSGLNALESDALDLLEHGSAPFPVIHGSLQQRRRIRVLGFTDVQLAATLRALASGDAPLVRIEGDPATPASWVVALTPDGGAVVDGRKDRIKLTGIDTWLGGVHLATPGPVWRWDAGAGALTRA